MQTERTQESHIHRKLICIFKIVDLLLVKSCNHIFRIIITQECIELSFCGTIYNDYTLYIGNN